MARGARRAGRTRHRESAWRAAGALLVTMAVLCALLAAPFAYAMVQLDGRPHHLAAVPISARECPAVHRIQAATQRFEDAFSAVAVSTEPWSKSRARLEDALTGMDRALGRGIPVVPPPVRSRFEVLLANVRRGELEVRSDASFNEVAFNGYVEVDAAHASYGAASKLVGDACGSLYVVTGGSVAPSRQLADMFAGIAKWVCGPQHTRCPPSPPTTLRSSGSRR